MTTYGVDRSGAAGGNGAAVTPVDAAVVTAKGDLIVGTASGAVDNLAAGTDEKRLVADSAQPMGLKYVADTVNYAVAAKGDLLAGTAADTVAPVTVGANSKVLTADSAQATGMTWNDVPLPRSYLAGLGLANNAGDATNDIDIAVGECRSLARTANIVLASALTKRLDATWAVGTNQGMLATGVAIANTTYHIFVIKRPDTGVVDIAADTSVTGANIAANTNAAYTEIRRIGSILRESGAIVPFTQAGDYFQRKLPLADHTGNNPGTSAVTATLLVPTGIRVIARVNAVVRDSDSAGAYIFLLTDLDCNDAEPSFGAPGNHGGNTGTDSRNGTQVDVRTNTSGQIRTRLLTSDANTVFTLCTAAWFDSRGRDD